ncbi:MAG: DNA repair protein RadC [Magnetococcales bacterium]|nr:DNA repair protein RadC [Magnetococcales bacterium]
MTARKKSSDKPKLHDGHRKRLRQRFFREGLEQFEDHQVLELLLFHAVPRRDTNEIAHLLLKRFGSLSAVLEADPKDLATIPGMGESAVAFVSLIPPLTRRYLTDSVSRHKPTLDDSRKTNAYLTPLMAGRTEEVFYVLCLNSSCQLLFPALISKGTVNEANIHPRHVVEAALRHKAASVIFAHNHPSGQLKASRADINITRVLVQALIPIGIKVLDHVIVAGRQNLSMAAEGLL